MDGLGSIYSILALEMNVIAEKARECLKVSGRSVDLVRRCWRGLRCEVRNALARVNPQPIIVLGNQKSGTTAIAALLAEMTGLSVSLDLRREISRTVLPMVRSREMSFGRFVRRNGLDFSRAIVKEPGLTFFYDELAEYFPQARFVFIVRDPRSNIRSILNRHKILGNLSGIPHESWRDMSVAWQRVFDGAWLGLSDNRYVEGLASRWRCASRVYLRYKEAMVLVRYEDFVEDKIGKIAALADVLGLQQVNDIADKVGIQYQPKGDRDVGLGEFFGEKNLHCIEEICYSEMQAFGYAAS